MACEKEDRVEDAMELYAASQQRGLIPEADTYTRISACGKSHKVEKAMELLAEMQTTGVNTDRISACEKKDKVEKAMELLAEMQQRDTLISACEKSHNGEKATGLYGEMQQVGLIPKVSTHNASSACEKGNKFENIELFVEMQKRDFRTSTALISACEKNHEVEKAM